MKKIDSLKKSAKSSAEWRGHKMTRFRTQRPTVAMSTCKTCGMGAFVDSNPAPNSIDICGQAVSLNCK